MSEVALLPVTAARTKTRARRGGVEPQPTWKLGDYITAEMRDRGITDQEELAAIIGVNQSSVSRWLNGESKGPSNENLRKLADFLGMPINELVLIKHRTPAPVSATALARDVSRLEGEVEKLNAKLEKVEALLDLLVRQAGASPAAVAKARKG
jgi:transcriptional regulator with XRE-family HTH domain